MSRSKLVSWVALQAKSKELDDIRDTDVYHFAPAKHRADIVLAYGAKISTTEQACQIHLKAAQGWSLSFWKFIRDLTVFDTDLARTKSYGCYSYFFLGKPSDKRLRYNVGGKADGKDDLQFRISGSDICNQSAALFFRPIDGVVVLRGDYTGPAFISPPSP